MLDSYLHWVAIHIGIIGDDADKIAKPALDLPITEMGIHNKDYKSHRKDDIDGLWTKVEPLLRDRRSPRQTRSNCFRHIFPFFNNNEDKVEIK